MADGARVAVALKPLMVADVVGSWPGVRVGEVAVFGRAVLVPTGVALDTAVDVGVGLEPGAGGGVTFGVAAGVAVAAGDGVGVAVGMGVGVGGGGGGVMAAAMRRA